MSRDGSPASCTTAPPPPPPRRARPCCHVACPALCAMPGSRPAAETPNMHRHAIAMPRGADGITRQHILLIVVAPRFAEEKGGCGCCCAGLGLGRRTGQGRRTAQDRTGASSETESHARKCTGAVFSVFLPLFSCAGQRRDKGKVQLSALSCVCPRSTYSGSGGGGHPRRHAAHTSSSLSETAVCRTGHAALGPGGEEAPLARAAPTRGRLYCCLAYWRGCCS